MFGMTHLRRPNKVIFINFSAFFFPQSYLLFGLRLSWVAISPRWKYFTTSLPSTSLQLHTGPRSQEHCGPGEAYFISFVNILQETIYKATTWSPLLNVWRSSVIDKCGGWRGKKNKPKHNTGLCSFRTLISSGGAEGQIERTPTGHPDLSVQRWREDGVKLCRSVRPRHFVLFFFV